MKTPLHYSCQFGSEVASSLLLKNGGDLEAKDSHGRSPFLYACMGDSTQIMTLLVRNNEIKLFSVMHMN